MRQILYSTLQFIERHVEGFFGALAAFLTIGFLVSAAALSIFVAVARAVRGGFTQSWDEHALQWFAHHRIPVLDQVALEVTTLGNGSVLIMIVLVASVFLWQTQHKWSVYVLLGGTFGGGIVNQLLKHHFNRARPSIVEWATTVHTTSFPSGHAMTSLITYGSIAYLVARIEGTRRLKRTIWVMAGIVILSIGLSRMYLGVHYPSDIIAGFIAGLGWLTFVIATVKAIQFFADRRPQTHVEEHDLKKT